MSSIEEERRIRALKEKQRLLSGLTGFGKKVYQGNPLMKAIVDPIRNVISNYDAGIQDGVPQIVASEQNPRVIKATPSRYRPETSDNPRHRSDLGQTWTGKPTFSKSLLDKYIEKNNQITGPPGTSDSLTQFDVEEFGSPPMSDIGLTSSGFKRGEKGPFNRGMIRDLVAGVGLHTGAKHHTPSTIPTPTNLDHENQQNIPSLWETWGSLADNPKERREAYLGSLKNIFMKKSLLDSIAKLAGGVSQGPAWAAMAVAELDAMEKFDSEERLHQQHKALFFREDGTYDPPKNRKEAIKRGQLLEYSVDQMKDILTIYPTEPDNRTNYQKHLAQLMKAEPGSAEAIALQKKLDEGENISAYERLLNRAVDRGWINDAELKSSVKSQLGLDADEETFTSLEKNIRTALITGAIDDKDAKEARRYALLGGKPGADKSFSARSSMVGLYLKDREVISATGTSIKRGALSFTEWLRQKSQTQDLQTITTGLGSSDPNIVNLGEISD